MSLKTDRVVVKCYYSEPEREIYGCCIRVEEAGQNYIFNINGKTKNSYEKLSFEVGRLGDSSSYRRMTRDEFESFKATIFSVLDEETTKKIDIILKNFDVLYDSNDNEKKSSLREDILKVIKTTIPDSDIPFVVESEDLEESTLDDDTSYDLKNGAISLSKKDNIIEISLNDEQADFDDEDVFNEICVKIESEYSADDKENVCEDGTEIYFYGDVIVIKCASEAVATRIKEIYVSAFGRKK